MSGETAVRHGSQWLRRVATVLGRPILRLLFRLKIEGNFDAFGAERLLVIANHESFLDGPLLGAFLPIDPVYVVHSQVVAHPVFRLLLRMVDHVAVDPANPMAIKSVVKLVESGRPVVIFPEGRITVTGSLMKVYDGPAFVASKTGRDPRAGAPRRAGALVLQPAVGTLSAAALSPRDAHHSSGHEHPRARGRRARTSASARAARRCAG